MTDSLTIFGTDFTGVTGIKATGTGNGTLTYIRPQGTKSITSNGTNIDVTEYAAVDVSVSGGTPRTSTDLIVSGATVTAPAGVYASDASASVASGSVTAPSTISGTGASVSASSNTLTLSKTVSVTPNVTTAGYVTAGTAGNASVSLSASVNTRTSTDLSASGATVTAPAGYYASQATKSVASMTLPTAASSTSSGTSKATITPGSAAQYLNIPTGYNDTASYYTIAAGGSTVKTATGTFTGNGTRTIDVSCTFEPDIVYFTSNPGTTSSSGTVAAIIVRDMMTATRYRNNSTTNSHYAIPDIADMNTNGSSYSWRATYNSTTSKLTLYCFSNNARSLLTNGRTYSYTFVKYTS